MTRFPFAVALLGAELLTFTGMALGAPGDRRTVTGVVEWPTTLTNERFVVLHGADPTNGAGDGAGDVVAPAVAPAVAVDAADSGGDVGGGGGVGREVGGEAGGGVGTGLGGCAGRYRSRRRAVKRDSYWSVPSGTRARNQRTRRRRMRARLP